MNSPITTWHCYPPLALAPQQTPPAMGPTVFADVARNQRSEEFCACRGNIDFSSYFGRFGISNMDCAASKSPRDLCRPPFAAVVRRRRSKPPTSPPLPDSGAVPSFQFLLPYLTAFFFCSMTSTRVDFFSFFCAKNCVNVVGAFVSDFWAVKCAYVMDFSA